MEDTEGWKVKFGREYSFEEEWDCTDTANDHHIKDFWELEDEPLSPDLLKIDRRRHYTVWHSKKKEAGSDSGSTQVASNDWGILPTPSSEEVPAIKIPDG